MTAAINTMDRDKSFREKALELLVLRAESTKMASDPVSAVTSIAFVLSILVNSGMAVAGQMDAGGFLGGLTITIAILLGKYGITLKRTVDDFTDGPSFGLF
jgi:hypothetical protein